MMEEEKKDGKDHKVEKLLSILTVGWVRVG
jgi:hypothetical protein